jgi:diguanylate cyclase (GGDEF)-like protein
MVREESQARDLMAFLYRFANSIVGLGSVSELFDTAFRMLADRFRVDIAVGVMLEQNLNLYLSRSSSARRIDELELMDRIRQSLHRQTGVSFDTTEAIVVSDYVSLSTEAADPNEGDVLRCEVSTVLHQDKRVAGLLALYRAQPEFTSEEESLFEVLTSLISMVLANIHAQRRIQKLADTDDLTGIGNKRSFRSKLAAEVERSHVYKVPLSVMMMDLDDFKAINDTHGHPMGDVILSELCGAIREILRPTDHFARFGGDEFTVILPHTDLEGAKATAERIVERVREMRLEADDDSVIALTLSIGIATYRDGDGSPSDLLQRADDRLYESKHSGKDRVSW